MIDRLWIYLSVSLKLPNELTKNIECQNCQGFVILCSRKADNLTIFFFVFLWFIWCKNKDIHNIHTLWSHYFAQSGENVVKSFFSRMHWASHILFKIYIHMWDQRMSQTRYRKSSKVKLTSCYNQGVVSSIPTWSTVFEILF